MKIEISDKFLWTEEVSFSENSCKKEVSHLLFSIRPIWIDHLATTQILMSNLQSKRGEKNVIEKLLVDAGAHK